MTKDDMIHNMSLYIYSLKIFANSRTKDIVENNKIKKMEITSIMKRMTRNSRRQWVLVQNSKLMWDLMLINTMNEPY